jgi:hypothetical protein
MSAHDHPGGVCSTSSYNVIYRPRVTVPVHHCQCHSASGRGSGSCSAEVESSRAPRRLPLRPESPRSDTVRARSAPRLPAAAAPRQSAHRDWQAARPWPFAARAPSGPLAGPSGSRIPKKSWLPRVLNAYLDFSIPVTIADAAAPGRPGPLACNPKWVCALCSESLIHAGS